MAAAYKCDRCGTYFSREKSADVPLRVVYKIDRINEDNYDLCNDCVEDLRLFINGSKIIKPEYKKEM